MSPTLAPVRDTSTLEQHIALIACGQRPGKTQPCDSCRRKGSGLLNIASTGAADAVAALICGTGKASSCHDCKVKAAEIIRLYNGEAE
ncbi:hypothetical protein [Streptomyces xantholiticus]|uniref:BFD-like [2Fe-2S]-binding domain-containing protein n=1 Tax=Streptomyces xantholiticus TaxID=68285 RepID=A0ABV1V0X5_9ACTN